MSSFSQNYNISCIHCEVTTLYFAITEQSWQNWSGLAAAEMKLNWTNSFLSDAWIEEFGNSSAFFFFFFLNSFKCVNPACYILGSDFYIYGTVVNILLRKEKYKSIRINSCCRKSIPLFTEVTLVDTVSTAMAIFLGTKIQRIINSCFFYSYPVMQFFITKKFLPMLSCFYNSNHLNSAKTARKACWEMLLCELITRELSGKLCVWQPQQLLCRANPWVAQSSSDAKNLRITLHNRKHLM